MNYFEHSEVCNQYRYNADEIYCTDGGTFVVAVPVEYNGYHRDGKQTRWQDAHKEIAVGLYVLGNNLQQVIDKFKEIVGWAPNLDTIYRWMIEYRVLR